MKLIRKLMIFLSFDKKTILLLIEAYYYLGWARLQKLKPFSVLSQALGEASVETSRSNKVSNRMLLHKISHAIQVMSQYTLWESQCFVKALAAKRMLEKRGIEYTIYFGTAKDENGKLIAHAWIRSGSYYVTGKEEMNKFTVVSTFAKHRTAVKGGRDDRFV